MMNKQRTALVVTTGIAVVIVLSGRVAAQLAAETLDSIGG